MSDEILKPCPFCGGDAESRYEGQINTPAFYISCVSCFARTMSSRQGGRAEMYWNNRLAVSKQEILSDFIERFKAVATRKLDNKENKWSGAIILDSLATAMEEVLREPKS
jgi:hypothetical protein